MDKKVLEAFAREAPNSLLIHERQDIEPLCERHDHT